MTGVTVEEEVVVAVVVVDGISKQLALLECVESLESIDDLLFIFIFISRLGARARGREGAREWVPLTPYPHCLALPFNLKFDPDFKFEFDSLGFVAAL